MESRVRRLEAAIDVVRGELGVEATPDAITPIVQVTSTEAHEDGREPHTHNRPSVEVTPPAVGTGELYGLPIAEAAARVLADLPAGSWTHCRDVGRMAIERGYRGSNPNQSPKSISDSFYHTMKRHDHVFEKRGPAFRLK